MKVKYGSILILLAILVAVAVAGCTSTTTSPSASTAATSQAGATTTPAASTAAASTPATTGATTLFDMGNVHWFEYNMVSNAGAQGTVTSTMRIDYDTEAYSGVSNAKHEKVQMTMGTGDTAMTTATDIYIDPTTAGKVLGGHTKATMGSTVLYDKDIAANDPSYAGYDYSGQASAAAPVLVGTEPVSVPKGTYNAQKYTVTSASGVVTYWIAAGVPVPVQMEMSDSSGNVATTMSLVDFG